MRLACFISHRAPESSCFQLLSHNEKAFLFVYVVVRILADVGAFPPPAFGQLVARYDQEGVSARREVRLPLKITF